MILLRKFITINYLKQNTIVLCSQYHDFVYFQKYGDLGGPYTINFKSKSYFMNHAWHISKMSCVPMPLLIKNKKHYIFITRKPVENYGKYKDSDSSAIDEIKIQSLFTKLDITYRFSQERRYILSISADSAQIGGAYNFHDIYKAFRHKHNTRTVAVRMGVYQRKTIYSIEVPLFDKMQLINL